MALIEFQDVVKKFNGVAVLDGVTFDVRKGEVLYVQVADSMTDESTRERELAPLRSIADNHPKWVVVRQGSYPPDVDGIRIVRAADFFLG